MNFQQFYVLLRSLFTKEAIDIEPVENNFPVYLAMRYISFVHPNLCVYIDEVINNYAKYQIISDPKIGYDTLKSILPKLPYRKIEYVKKPVTNAVKNKEVSDEDLKKLAEILEISKREVLGYFQISDISCQKH